MMLKNIKYIVSIIVLGISFSAYSQSYSNFESSYNKAKLFFDSKEYDQAITGFEPLCEEADNNPFAPYARFYKAKSYIALEKYSEARFVLVKLSDDFSKWAKKDEVSYLLAYAQLNSKQYIASKITVENIKDDSLRMKGTAMLYDFVVKEDSTELLSRFQYINKKDKELAEIIAHKLKSSHDSLDVFLLNYLIQDYDLLAEDFGGKSGVKKENYQIALLLPLNMHKSNAYKNIKILDILKGAEYAVDSLNELGKKVELKVFDTESSLVKINKILQTASFQEVDLILGPLSKKACQVVSTFSEENKIINFNFNREDHLFENKDFVYSSISSHSTIGIQLAQTAYKSFDTSKTARIYYHVTYNKEDSIMAGNYKAELERLGMKVAVFSGVPQDVTDFRRSLGQARESQTSHVVVFSKKHNLMASTLISIWEGSNKKIPVIAPKEWLDIHLIGYDQFQRRNIHFMYSEYISLDNENSTNIKKKYLNEFGVRPSSLKYLAVGYDVTFFVGNQLHEYGTFFHEDLTGLEDKTAVLTSGLDFSKGNTNSNVPLLKFGEEFEFENISQSKN